MATREELVDALAGFTLFGDLTRPQLTSVVHLMQWCCRVAAMQDGFCGCVHRPLSGVGVFSVALV